MIITISDAANTIIVLTLHLFFLSNLLSQLVFEYNILFLLLDKIIDFNAAVDVKLPNCEDFS
jgi:hypothetical protein